MCQELEPWCNEVLSLCSQQNAFTQSRLHTQGGHEYVHSFFAPEDTSLQTDSPRINRASVARMQSVSLPSDTSDVDSAMTGMLKLLPNVTQELLLNYCGGAAKQGWMYKEAENTATSVSNWARRWFILWPKESHPSFGRLLESLSSWLRSLFPPVSSHFIVVPVSISSFRLPSSSSTFSGSLSTK